jgi:hypothetical protein
MVQANHADVSSTARASYTWIKETAPMNSRLLHFRGRHARRCWLINLAYWHSAWMRHCVAAAAEQRQLACAPGSSLRRLPPQKTEGDRATAP